MIKVELKNYDTSEKYQYHARTLEIRVSSSTSITTPIRGITSTEMSAKATIPAEIPIDAEIGEIMIKLTTGKRRNIGSFLRKNSAYKSISRSLLYQKLTMQYFPLTFALIQPTNTAISFLHENNYVDKFIRMSLALQIEDLGMDIITIPWVAYPPEKLVKVYWSYQKSYPNKIVVPFISLKDSHYVEKFLKTIAPYLDQMRFIGVLYKPVADVRPSYDHLWSTLYDKDVAIILADVKRDQDVSLVPNLSVPHYTEFVVGDVITREVPHGAGSYRPPHPIDTRIKFFNREDLTVNPLLKVKQEHGWIERISEILGHEEFVVKALKHYQEAQENTEKFNILNAISKVHEFKESREEFIRSQEYIKQTDTIDYIKEKRTLKKVFLEMSRQKTLF